MLSLMESSPEGKVTDVKVQEVHKGSFSNAGSYYEHSSGNYVTGT